MEFQYARPPKEREILLPIRDCICILTFQESLKLHSEWGKKHGRKLN